MNEDPTLMAILILKYAADSLIPQPTVGNFLTSWLHEDLDLHDLKHSSFIFHTNNYTTHHTSMNSPLWIVMIKLSGLLIGQPLYLSDFVIISTISCCYLNILLVLNSIMKYCFICTSINALIFKQNLAFSKIQTHEIIKKMLSSMNLD